MTDKYCIIGDLHGRIDTLNTIVSKSPGYHYVFLGDTIHHKPFFKRARKTSPIRILRYIKNLTDNNTATLLLGNHENYLLENLILPKSQIRHREVKHTLQCLKELRLEERLTLVNWLNLLPMSLEFESFGKLYRCAHAYYPTKSTTRSQTLLGLGYSWFRQDDLFSHIDVDAEYFLGHYGYPYFRKNLKIIDATNFEGVGVYYTDREEFLIYY